MPMHLIVYGHHPEIRAHLEEVNLSEVSGREVGERPSEVPGDDIGGQSMMVEQLLVDRVASCLDMPDSLSAAKQATIIRGR